MDGVYNDDLFDAFAVASDHVYIYAQDMATGISRWSKECVSYFGLPDEYIKDVGDIWIMRIHPEDRDRYQEDITQVFSGKKDHHQCEYRALNRDDEYVWIECRGTMIYDKSGHAKVFAGMMTRLDARNKYDPLTHLKSIYSFNMLDFDGRKGTILLVGFDGFRDVITRYGYSFGDSILCQFAHRLDEFCGITRMAYRLEGDEFLVVTPNGSKEDAVRMFSDLQAFTADLGNGKERVHLSLSGGAVMYPEDTIGRESLIANIEYALKFAKTHCRGELVFYADDVANAKEKEIKIHQELIRCIHNGFTGFQLYYQPLIKADTQSLAGCEALLRWAGPKCGPVPVEQIISLLEQDGRIREVGYWIFEEALKTAIEFQGEQDEFLMGINVSYLQFKEETFAEKVIEIARKYPINPKNICIELTESTKVEDFAGLEKCFTRLREFGFKISLDDFGIAYSTLLNLRNLPTDQVKIDHSFVRGLTKENYIDQAIIESVVTLCNRLNMEIVIEGVETANVLDVVKQYSVNYYQGYHFARPMPLAQFRELVKGQK